MKNISGGFFGSGSFHRHHSDELSWLILVFLTQRYTLVIWIKSWQKVVSNYFPTNSFQNCQIGDIVTFIFINHHWFSAIVNRLYLIQLKTITYSQQTNKIQVWLVSKMFPSISKLSKNKGLLLDFFVLKMLLLQQAQKSYFSHT